MTVFSGKQVVPVDYEAEVSQRLLQALVDGDMRTATACVADSLVDVNFVGAISLKTRKSDVVLRNESASEIRVEYEEFKTDVTALFLAVNAGNVALVKKLLSIGADVNQKLFRGFATTVAVREGHLEVLEVLLKAGASQPACEESLVEASCHGRARFTELLMGTDLIRPQVAVHALATACCRGFVDVVGVLLKFGVDANSNDRLLLQSSKPSLYTNVDCTALVAAIVNRQVSAVRVLLQAGARTDIMVRLGAWAWDSNTGEEIRVGAGLAEPYPLTWCAVEYFETSGSILRSLLELHNSNAPHRGRTLLHHAILCGNAGAIRVLLECGTCPETPIKTLGNTELRAIHIAAQNGATEIIQLLVSYGCNINSRTEAGDTALMISTRNTHGDCVKTLAMAGADFGLVNKSGQSAASIAGSNKWSIGFERVVSDLIRYGVIPNSSNGSVFSPLLFAAKAGDAEALKSLLIKDEGTDMDYQDEDGRTAAMLAAMKGHIEAFRVIVYAGANVKLLSRLGETAVSLSEMNGKRDEMERVMLEYALEKEKGNDEAEGGFYALHCAARRGDVKAAELLTGKGYGVNVPDGEGYTPLMLAAKEGHGQVCEFLIGRGAKWEEENGRGETAVTMARGEAERAIKDEVARRKVKEGGEVRKHTKGGKGKAHRKELRMEEGRGVLSWGKSGKRNVVCKQVEVGGSPKFRRNRKGKKEEEGRGVFRVVTTENKEFHFECEGGVAAAEMWVRGIRLVTRLAICGGD
ncbi:PREDICTED: ankyrin-1 [Tarenaya hassleriana]|uniref:ankyrin-1 n=1 Tax=Tarenaya hassleriana TaxID=28532 RepID=UPI00053C50F0|nr:PREDICTED: ankyrin-1 [Tarenaya hassleriana]